MAVIIDGKKISQEILKNLKETIKKKKLTLKLGVVLVGEDKSSKIFIREKEKASQKIGIGFELFKFKAKIKQNDLKREIKKIVKRKEIKGIVIQLPLPKKFNEEEILDLIPLKKDIDVLSSESLGKFYNGKLGIYPPSISAIDEIFKRYKIKLKGKNVVVIGQGRLIGKPLSIYLVSKKATFSMVNKFTRNISDFTKKAQILISGVGKPEMIKGNMIRKGVVAIDFGCSFKNGKLKGDFDFESVFKKADFLTPVPGGTGPITVACLLKNLLKLNL